MSKSIFLNCWPTCGNLPDGKRLWKHPATRRDSSCVGGHWPKPHPNNWTSSTPNMTAIWRPSIPIPGSYLSGFGWSINKQKSSAGVPDNDGTAADFFRIPPDQRI